MYSAPSSICLLRVSRFINTAVLYYYYYYYYYYHIGYSVCFDQLLTDFLELSYVTFHNKIRPVAVQSFNAK